MVSDAITNQERRKYEEIWKHDSYRERSPGERFFLRAYGELVPQFRDTVCDWGIGTGKAAQKFVEKGHKTYGVDIAKNAVDRNVFKGQVFVGTMWDKVVPDGLSFDFGYCTDVMEHIPPNKVIDCLKQMKKVTRDEIWFSIANFHDREGDKIGKTLHLCVRPAEWWAASFARVFPRFTFSSENKHYIVRAFCEPRWE